MQNSSVSEELDGNVRTASENNITNGCTATSCGMNEGKMKEQQNDLAVVSFEDRRGTDDSDGRETVENTENNISLTGKMNIQRSQDDSDSICRNSEHINADETDDKKACDTKEASRMTWSPPDASYRLKRYQNEPMKIENYEPGMSSIVLQDPFINNYYNPPIEKPGEHSKYTENNPKMKYEIRKADRTQSLTETSVRDHYRKVQKGGDIPLGGLRCPIPPIKAHHRFSMTQKSIRSNVQTSLEPNSPKDASTIISSANELSKTDRRPHSASAASTSTYVLDRRTKDELSAARKRELEIALAEARRKRLQEEAESNRARRHCDYFHSPHGNSPVALNRYDFDDMQFGSGSSLPTSPLPVERPILKARALYTFKAQTNRELSLNKGDTVYILRLIDGNWYEGQRHGTVGIFPVDYVEVLESYHDQNCKDVGSFVVAKFDFAAQYPSEISFQKGDVLKLTNLVDDNWFEAAIGNRSGLIPKSYVEPLQYRLTVPLTIPVESSSTEISQHDSPGTMSSTSSCLSSGVELPLLTSSRNFHGSEWNAHRYVSNSHSSNMEADRDARNKATMQNPELVEPFRERSNSLGAVDHTAADPQSNRYVDTITPYWQYHHPDTSEDDLDFQGMKSVEHQNAVTTDAFYTSEQRYGAIKPSGNNEFLPYIVYQALYSYAPLDDDELELSPGDIIYVTEIFDDGWYVGISRRTKTYGTFPGNYVQRLRVFHSESSAV